MGIFFIKKKHPVISAVQGDVHVTKRSLTGRNYLCAFESRHNLARGLARSVAPTGEHNHADSHTHVDFCVQVKRKRAPLFPEPCLIVQHFTLDKGEKWWLPPGERRYVAALGKKSF